MGGIIRCPWSEGNDLLRTYHDREWGVPVHDDRTMFEHLFLEAMQCGLNWNMMLVKREIFRRCFADFDYEQIAHFSQEDVQRIMEVPGMIRSPAKIQAEISNARCVLEIQKKYGTFCDYLWRWTNGKTRVYASHADRMPAQNELSQRIAKDMKKRGFQYIGPVTLYSHLQACGIINDHARECFRFAELTEKHPTEYLD